MDELENIRKRKMESMKENIKDKKEPVKITASDLDFEENVIEKSKEVLVVVDFWAQWCMPCLMLGPVLEEIVEGLKGKAVLAKVNVDESPGISQKYMIESIPAVKFFRNGKVIDEFVGALPEPYVRKYFQRHLGD